MKTKAAVLYEHNKPLIVEELAIPKLKEGQVLVKIMASGICHSQLNEIKGNRGPDKFLPHTLGHEGAGIVEEAGRNVRKVKKGDRVVLTWIKGTGMDIPSTTYVNKNGVDVNSGAISTFIEYSVVSENRLIKVTADIPFDMASLLGCAIPTGAGAIKNTLDVKKENTLAIFGIGGIGAGALIYASALGCKKLIAVDINDSKLKLAKEIGATDVINPLREDVVSKIREITHGSGVDYSLECSGVKDVMETAFASIHNGGTAVIAGNLRFNEKITINPFDLILGKKIIGTWGGETKPEMDIPFYAGLYASGKLKLGRLITHRFKLDSINEAFLKVERSEAIRAVIEF